MRQAFKELTPTQSYGSSNPSSRATSEFPLQLRLCLARRRKSVRGQGTEPSPQKLRTLRPKSWSISELALFLDPRSAGQQAAYRFLHLGKVAGEDVLQSQQKALSEQVRRESTVLPVQDTTTLNHTGLEANTPRLGLLLERSTGARGKFVHAAVAFTEGAAPVGGERPRKLSAAGTQVGGRAVQGESAPVPGVRLGTADRRLSAGTRAAVAGTARATLTGRCGG